MEIRELRSFVLLAEQLHFGRASGLLNLSQPALTKQIRKLEDDLGAPLFERGKRGTSLSAFGKIFLPEARIALQAFDQLEDRGRRAARGETGRLNLGFGFHTFELVPRWIVQLREVAPGVDVTLRDMSTAEQMDALHGGRIDLGFARLPVPRVYRTLPVVKDRLALVSSVNSPVKITTLADARDQPFVALSEARAPGFYRHVIRICGKHGFYPRVVQQVPELTTAIALVRAGLGVAVIPESFWSGRFEGIQVLSLKDKDAGWQVSAVWHRDNGNPALSRFLELMRRDPAVSGKPWSAF